MSAIAAVARFSRCTAPVVGRRAAFASVRAMSAFTEVERGLGEGGTTAVVRMQRAPVNSMNMEFMMDVVATMKELQQDSSVKGVVLTSAYPKIFAAGLDITGEASSHGMRATVRQVRQQASKPRPCLRHVTRHHMRCPRIAMPIAVPCLPPAPPAEMHDPDMKRFEEFWHWLQELFLTLWGYEKPLFAAINGNAPAGGCLMALCCDYRIMYDGPYSIGLNETQLGIGG